MTSGMGNLSISGAVPTPTGTSTTAGPQLYTPQTGAYPTPTGILAFHSEYLLILDRFAS